MRQISQAQIRGWSATDAFGLLLFGAVVLAGIWYFTRDTVLPIDRSAIGHRGLVAAVAGQGGEISYAGLTPVTGGTIGLRILPLLDTDLDTRFERPEEDAAFLKTGTERDMLSWILREKTELLPTLVVAPKWTRAMRHSGYAHPSLLLSPDSAHDGMRRLNLMPEPPVQPDVALLEINAYGADGLLYAPQLFAEELADGCTAELSTDWGPLLVRCERSGQDHPVWFLSDPDLLNNHGLALAENRALAHAMLTDIAGDRPILIDTTTRIIARPERTPQEARKWSDLLRFFDWPLSVIWIGVAALTVLLLWRSWVRFGPARHLFDDRLSASRGVSIAAKARILRLAGNDPRLFGAHVENRIRRIERELFGTAGSADPIARIVGLLKRSDPERAAGFARAAVAATTPATDISIGQLQTLLEDFEHHAERLTHGPR